MKVIACQRNGDIFDLIIQKNAKEYISVSVNNNYGLIEVCKDLDELDNSININHIVKSFNEAAKTK